MVALHAALATMLLSGMGQTVLLDFSADWCGPCRAMNPTIDGLITAGYPVQRVNIDRDRALAAKYRVQSVPCFVMVVDGREVDRVVGGTTFSRLERMCKLAATGAAPPAVPSPLPLKAPSADMGTPAGLPATAAGSFGQANPAVGNIPMEAPLAGSQGVADAALLAASVRIKVEDRDGHSCGSGTIIDSRGGEALVLTCGHLFRDSQGKGRIVVEVFTNGVPQQLAGRLVSYDLTRDVGLIAIQPQCAVGVARLAPPNYRIARGMPVASVGCNNGQDPTVRRSQVASLDKFLGPPNIQVAGQPVEGRSGGGLFSPEGYVIGVCNAADPSDQEGLFAAPGSIRAELDKDQLAFVYNAPSETPTAQLASMTGNASPASPGPLPGPIPGARPTAAELAAASGMQVPAAEPSPGLAPHEQAAIEEIRRRLKEGAEIVCIVRPRGNSDAKSEIIRLDHASPEFLRQLAAEAKSHDIKQLASERTTRDLAVTSYEEPKQPPKQSPKPRKVLLEWTAPNGTPAASR